MKKILLILMIGISLNPVVGQNKLESKDIIRQISEAKSILKIKNDTIVSKLNFANVGNLIEGKISTSTTIVRKNKHRSDTTTRYSQKNRAQIDVNLEFISCVFEGEIDAKNSFKNKKLSGQIISQFNASLVFKDCLFMEDVDLSSVEFTEDLIFVNCIFKKPLDLGGIRSTKKFIFERCTFDEICSFNNMLVAKKAVLDQCVFKDDLSLASTIFSVEPEIVNSEFQTIKLQNCQIIDQPFFWYFEDDTKYESLLSMVKYDKAFYDTKFNHSKVVTIYTSRSNWGGNDARKILKLWDARAEIKSDEGKYKVWGRIIWDKNRNVLIVDHAKFKAPNGKILVEGEKLEIDIDQPSKFKVL